MAGCRRCGHQPYEHNELTHGALHCTAVSCTCHGYVGRFDRPVTIPTRRCDDCGSEFRGVTLLCPECIGKLYKDGVGGA